MPDHLRGLNDEQREAVRCIEGPLLVLAGAGTGKTRVVTCRIAEIVARGTPAEGICAVTFTNKAAAEMKARVAALLPRGGTPPAVSTFHSLGARILRESGRKVGIEPDFTIADSSDQVDLVADAVRDLGLIAVMRANDAHQKISRWKTAAKTPREALRDATDPFEESVATVYGRYEEELRRRNLIDFDDLIVRTLELLRDHEGVAASLQERYRYLLVDEYQDTNDAQYDLMRKLAGKRCNVCVVGDDDQSIYGWRGADPGRILRFQRDFRKARVVTLTRNYRSTQTILDAANRLIGHNEARRKKELRSAIPDAGPITVFIAPDERDEMGFVGGGVQRLIGQGAAPAQIAVLFRTNRQCRPLEVALRQRGIRYKVMGTFSFFDRREVRDLLAYGRAAVNASDDSAFIRIMNLPARGLGAASLDLLRKRAADGRQNLRPAAEALLAGGAVPDRMREGLRDLAGTLSGLAAQAETGGVAGAIEALIERIRYRDHLAKDTPDPLELATRQNTVQDLVDVARDFDARSKDKGLRAFLQGLALQEQDRDEDDERPAVSLLTIHAAKGLEFDHVFIAGVEEGMLPHKKITGEEEEDVAAADAGIEEERRLFYVALTRAKRVLSLSWSKTRVRWGQEMPSTPSRFLTEMGTAGVVVQDGCSKEPASPEFRKRALLELAARFPSKAKEAKEPKEAPG